MRNLGRWPRSMSSLGIDLFSSLVNNWIQADRARIFLRSSQRSASYDALVDSVELKANQTKQCNCSHR